MLNVRELIRYDTAVMMHKMKYFLIKGYVCMFHTVDEFHDTPVRETTTLILDMITWLLRRAKEVSPPTWGSGSELIKEKPEDATLANQVIPGNDQNTSPTNQKTAS